MRTPQTNETNSKTALAGQASSNNSMTLADSVFALSKLRKFIGMPQKAALSTLIECEERQFFWGKLVELARTVETMPKTYETDGQGDDATVHLHYFLNGSDWYITERDMEAEQLQTFGLADIFGDGGELGYISIAEIVCAGAELDLHWTAATLAQVKAKRAVEQALSDVNSVYHPMHY